MEDSGIHVEIITPKGTSFKGSVSYLKLQGYEGEMGILKNHAPLIALLQPGECHIKNSEKDLYLALSEGFLKIQDNRVIVVVNFAYKQEEIDMEEQKRIVQEEESYFKEIKREEPELSIHRLRKKRAMACINVAMKRK